MTFSLYKVWKGEYNTDDTTGMANDSLETLIETLENSTGNTLKHEELRRDILKECEYRKEELKENDRW